MKKLLVVAAAFLLIVPAVASAQGVKMTQSEFNKAGKISLSGNIVSMSTVKNDDDDNSPMSYGIAPTVGYMVIDNLQVNFGLGYNGASNDADGDAEVTSSTWMIAPGVRYYLDMLSKNNLFPSLGASYTIGATSTESGGNTADEDMSSLRVGAGITQAMGGAQGGHMTLNIDYVMNTNTPDGEDDVNESGINVGVGFGLYF